MSSVWFGLLRYLYEEGGILNHKQHSMWWRDLKALDRCLPFAQDWFQTSVRRKLGNRAETKFWYEQWCCQWRLKDLYPSPFEQSDNQFETVAEFREWDNGN